MNVKSRMWFHQVSEKEKSGECRRENLTATVLNTPHQLQQQRLVKMKPQIQSARDRIRECLETKSTELNVRSSPMSYLAYDAEIYKSDYTNYRV